MAVNMPKPEMVKFDGDPINYWNFINSFEENIANEHTKLMYLSQLCVGRAKEAIECCVLMHPFDGYKRACQILAQQFGQPHVITHKLIKKVVGRQQLKPNDGKSISDLVRDIRRCQITLQQMGYTADLNASDTLLKVHLLPIHLQSKWAERAQNLIMAGMEPHAGHLTDFTLKAAELFNTMYGKNIGRNDKDSPRPFQQNGQQRFSGRWGVTLLSMQDGQARQWKCQCCEGMHKLITCRQFAKKTHKEKISIAHKNRLCDNCLKPWHFAQACRNYPACKVDGCKKEAPHSLTLHLTNKQEDVTNFLHRGRWPGAKDWQTIWDQFVYRHLPKSVSMSNPRQSIQERKTNWNMGWHCWMMGATSRCVIRASHTT